MREDYDKFISLFPETYKGKYKIVSWERNKKWSRTSAKVYDDTTILIEPTGDKIQIGINIDLFPIDQVPDDIKDWERYDKWRRFIQNFKYSLKDSPLFRNRPIWKTMLLFILRPAFFWLPSRFLCKYLDKLARKYNDTPRNFVFENSLGMIVKNRFKKNIFDDIVYIPFENYSFKAFKNYDEYLRNAYGNYMQLPPKEEQISHHKFQAYIK